MYGRLKAWYLHPDQFIARNEVRWTLRWLSRTPGAFWLVLYAAMKVVPVAFPFLVGASGQLTSSAVRMGTLLALLGSSSVLVRFGIWIYLLQIRTFAPIRQGRIQDLLVAPIGGKTMWPGLLLAPIVWLAVLAMVDCAAALAGWHFWSVNYRFDLPRVASPTVAIHADPLFELLAILRPPLELLPRITAVALVVRGSLPWGKILHILIWWVVANVILDVIPSICISFPIVWLAIRSVGPRYSPTTLHILASALLAPLLSLLIAFPLWRGSVRALQKKETYEKLRQAAMGG